MQNTRTIHFHQESTSAIGTKKLLIACRFFDNDKYKYEYERSEIEWRREQQTEPTIGYIRCDVFIRQMIPWS